MRHSPGVCVVFCRKLSPEGSLQRSGGGGLLSYVDTIIRKSLLGSSLQNLHFCKKVRNSTQNTPLIAPISQRRVESPPLEPATRDDGLQAERVARIECSDICEPLVAIWRLV